jgi:hypothetical protein
LLWFQTRRGPELFRARVLLRKGLIHPKPLKFFWNYIEQHFLKIEHKTETVVHVLHLVCRKPADSFSQEGFVQGYLSSVDLAS